MPELPIALETIVSEARCDLGHDSWFRPKKVCRKAPVSQGRSHRGSAQAIEGNFIIISTHSRCITRWPITIGYTRSTWLNRKFRNLGTHRFPSNFWNFSSNLHSIHEHIFWRATNTLENQDLRFKRQSQILKNPLTSAAFDVQESDLYIPKLCRLTPWHSRFDIQ